MSETTPPTDARPAHERGMEPKFHGLLPGRQVAVQFNNHIGTNGKPIVKTATVIEVFAAGMITANVQFNERRDSTIRLSGGRLVTNCAHTVEGIPYGESTQQSIGPVIWYWPAR